MENKEEEEQEACISLGLEKACQPAQVALCLDSTQGNEGVEMGDGGAEGGSTGTQHLHF